MKSNGISTGQSGNYSSGWNARRSLAILRQSLRGSVKTQLLDAENDEEMEIDDADVENSSNMQNSGIKQEAVIPNIDMEIHQSENNPNTDMMKSDDMPNKGENACERSIINSENIEEKILNSLEKNLISKSQQQQENISLNLNPCLSIVPFQLTQITEMPTSSMSPKIDGCSRKSLRTSLLMSAFQENLKENDGLRPSGSSSNWHSASNTLVTTERLKKSLHRGLEIFDLHQQKVSMRRSFKFSPKNVHVKELVLAMKVDRGIQTLPLESDSLEDRSLYICSYCKNRPLPLEYKDASSATDMQLVPVNGFHHSEKSIQKVPKVRNLIPHLFSSYYAK